MASDKDKINSSVKWGGRILAGLGAVGTLLSNYLAFLGFLSGIGRLNIAVAQSLAVIIGGAFSGLVNLWMNLDLLESFFKRFTNKGAQVSLKGWRKFRYYAGSLIFIATGILFGMTSFAFGGFGLWASLGIASGLLVSIIMMIQELETWWQSFDEETQQSSFKYAFVKWAKSLTPAKTVGILISLGNILALSLLFTLGLTNFLIMAGIPLFPAIIAGFTVSFTAGAFTEFYFYNYFLADFCDKVAEKWQNFLKLSFSNKIMGAISVSINASVNAIACYAGIVLFNSLLASAGMSILPLAVIITASVFCGLASFILGSDFWIKMLLPKAIKEGYSKVEVTDERLSPSSAQQTPPDTLVREKAAGKDNGKTEAILPLPVPTAAS